MTACLLTFFECIYTKQLVLEEDMTIVNMHFVNVTVWKVGVIFCGQTVSG